MPGIEETPTVKRGVRAASPPREGSFATIVAREYPAGRRPRSTRGEPGPGSAGTRPLFPLIFLDLFPDPLPELRPGHAHLLHAVAEAQRDRGVLLGFVVDGDAEGGAGFVLAAVAAAMPARFSKFTTVLIFFGI